MNFSNPASYVLWNYLGTLDRICGLYLDSTIAYQRQSHWYEEYAKENNVPAGKGIFFGNGPPNRDEAKYRHYAKFPELIERNSKNGSNQILLGNACLLYVYSEWEHNVRPRYAQILGISKSDIQSDLMGDIRIYRNALSHSNGVLRKKYKNA